MNCSSQDIFAWTGAVLANIGFIAIIGWGSYQTWFIGFVLAAVYAAALFCFARQLEKRQGSGSYGRLISILYCLAMIAVGVTGFFLPANLFGGCNQNWSGGGGYGYDYESSQWKTDIAQLPDAVQAWAKQENSNTGPSSFLHLPAINTTLFRGSEKSYDEYLWSVVDGSEPVVYKTVLGPHNFVKASETTACFVANGIACYADQQVQQLSSNNDGEFDYVEDLASFGDGNVWYKGYQFEYGGFAIVSLDPTTMIQTIHSERVTDAEDDPETTNSTTTLSRDEPEGTFSNCSKTMKRLQTLCFLVTSAIPVFVLSILLWKSKTISSMGLTSYTGFLAIFSSIVHIIDTSTMLWDSYVLSAGFALFGAVYVLYFMLRAVFDRDTPAMRWGAYTAAVGFVVAMVNLLFFLPVSDSFWSWLVMAMVAFVPLSLVGAVSESWLLTLLGAGGAFACSVRICIYLVSKASGSGAVLVGFATLAVAGVIVGVAGVALSKCRVSLKKGLATVLAPIDRRVENVLGSRVPDGEIETATKVPESKTAEEVSEARAEEGC